MDKRRNVYLNMKTLAEAREIARSQIPLGDALGTEAIPVPQAVGRILAEPVFARTSAPHFNAAAMDGVAVDAASTFGASAAQPIELEIGRNAVYVNTGHVMPGGTDAVIMIEQIHVLDNRRIEIDNEGVPIHIILDVDRSIKGFPGTEHLCLTWRVVGLTDRSTEAG